MAELIMATYEIYADTCTRPALLARTSGRHFRYLIYGITIIVIRDAYKAKFVRDFDVAGIN